MVQIDETGHTDILVPNCQWCGQELDGHSKDGLHDGCAEELKEALESN